MRRLGPNLDQTWTGPPGPGLRWTGSRSRFSGPDLEVRVHSLQDLAGPDPDLTAKGVTLQKKKDMTSDNFLRP